MNSPALALTPEKLKRQIVEAGSAGRSEDRRVIAAVRQTIEEIASKLGRQLDSHVMAGEQTQRERHIGLIALMVGALLWAIIAGPIARTMPASWQWPEWMAARTLRMPMWEGGQRLMQAGNAGALAGVIAANRLMVANQEALEGCRKQAAKAKKAVRCAIQVEAGN